MILCMRAAITCAPVQNAEEGREEKPGECRDWRLEVSMLNAQPDFVKQEAQIIAQAGLPASVTIATNMAGRGTDIILGGNPHGLVQIVLANVWFPLLMGGELRQHQPPAVS